MDTVLIPEKSELLHIKLKEYEESQEEFDLVPSDCSFIQKIVNDGKLDSKIKIVLTEDKKFKLRALSFIGVIRLPSGIRVEIAPKIEGLMEKLLFILCYTYNVRIDPYDARTLFKEGSTFLDVIGFLFKQELEGIIELGLLRRYIEEIDNLNYLRGKMLLKEQMKHNYVNKQRFYCDYDELSYDNLENQTVLYALNLLTQIVSDKKLESELLMLREAMELWVTPRIEIQITEAEKITFNRLNEYYETLLELSKLVIQNKFIRDITTGEVLAFGFLIDMNKVFEKFVFKLIKEIYPDKEIIEQEQATNLLKPENIKIKPDILIKNKISAAILLVLDTKYKHIPENQDFYQIIAYSLAHKKSGVLIYPYNEQISRKYEEEIKNGYEIPESIDTRIYVKTINLLVEGDNFEIYLSNIKEELKTKLSVLLEVITPASNNI